MANSGKPSCALPVMTTNACAPYSTSFENYTINHQFIYWP